MTAILKIMRKLSIVRLLLMLSLLMGVTIGTNAVASTVKVGVLVAQTGPASIFGPASKNLAELAKKQINANGGILGNDIELFHIDVGGQPADARKTVLKAWKKNNIDVFVGMHNSAVRNVLTKLFKGKVPYVYTATHSGGECSPATFILGETPQQQLEVTMPWMIKEKGLKKWYLIGNDYVWPRSTNKFAKEYLAEAGAEVVGEEYLPFAVKNYDANLKNIQESGADAVLVTLVGGDSVQFNRSFSLFGLDENIVRLGTLMEANTLAGIGLQNAKNIYSTSGYFASIDSLGANKLKQEYYAEYGNDAPALSSLAESVYEGMLFVKAISEKAGEVSANAFSKHAEGTSFLGPRGNSVMHKRHVDQNIYLAEASTTVTGGFNVIKQFDNVSSGATCN